MDLRFNGSTLVRGLFWLCWSAEAEQHCVEQCPAPDTVGTQQAAFGRRLSGEGVSSCVLERTECASPCTGDIPRRPTTQQLGNQLVNGFFTSRGNTSRCIIAGRVNVDESLFARLGFIERGPVLTPWAASAIVS